MTTEPRDAARTVPVDKGDGRAARNLRRASKAQVLAHAAELPGWIADGSQPIARRVMEALTPYALDIPAAPTAEVAAFREWSKNYEW